MAGPFSSAARFLLRNKEPVGQGLVADTLLSTAGSLGGARLGEALGARLGTKLVLYKPPESVLKEIRGHKGRQILEAYRPKDFAERNALKEHFRTKAGPRRVAWSKVRDGGLTAEEIAAWKEIAKIPVFDNPVAEVDTLLREVLPHPNRIGKGQVGAYAQLKAWKDATDAHAGAVVGKWANRGSTVGGTMGGLGAQLFQAARKTKHEAKVDSLANKLMAGTAGAGGLAYLLHKKNMEKKSSVAAPYFLRRSMILTKQAEIDKEANRVHNFLARIPGVAGVASHFAQPVVSSAVQPAVGRIAAHAGEVLNARNAQNFARAQGMASSLPNAPQFPAGAGNVSHLGTTARAAQQADGAILKAEQADMGAQQKTIGKIQQLVPGTTAAPAQRPLQSAWPQAAAPAQQRAQSTVQSAAPTPAAPPSAAAGTTQAATPAAAVANGAVQAKTDELVKKFNIPSEYADMVTDAITKFGPLAEFAIPGLLGFRSAAKPTMGQMAQEWGPYAAGGLALGAVGGSMLGGRRD